MVHKIPTKQARVLEWHTETAQTRLVARPWGFDSPPGYKILEVQSHTPQSLTKKGAVMLKNALIASAMVATGIITAPIMIAMLFIMIEDSFDGEVFEAHTVQDSL